MSECSHDCSSCSESCGEREAPTDFRESPHELSRIRKVIGVVSGKGGVGKSLVCSMLAVLLNRRGHHTAILDADITGPSIPTAFGLHGHATGDEQAIYPLRTKTGIDVISINLLLENASDPVIWRGPVIAGVVRQFWTDVVWNDVDYLFVDMPPGTGDVPLTVFQTMPVDGIVVVSSPQELVSMIVEKAVRMADTMKIPILGIVENMSCVQCPDCDKKINLFGEGKVDEVALRHGLPVLAKLPINPALARAVDAGVIELFEGDWMNAAADLIENL